MDVLWNNAVLGMYLVLSGIGITIFHMVEEREWRGWKAQFAGAAMPILIQYSFGNLFSGLIVFYSRSANVLSTWLFVLALAALVVFNESFSHLYRRFRYQMAIWFFLLLTFMAYVVPVVVSNIGPSIFAASVLISALLLFLFVQVLRSLIPKRVKLASRSLFAIATAITVMFVVAYVNSWIPPLPLALKDAAVAHEIVHKGDGYELTVEERPWWQFWARYADFFHYTEGDTAYVYTSVFAPSGLSLPVEHEWQHYNKEVGEWQTVSTVAFTVSGGRDGGYRGYSLTRRLAPGAWRVNVKTDYGTLIGRVTFTAQPSDAHPAFLELSR